MLRQSLWQVRGQRVRYPPWRRWPLLQLGRARLGTVVRNSQAAVCYTSTYYSRSHHHSSYDQTHSDASRRLLEP